MEFCFEMTPVWVGQRNPFSSDTLPHTLPFPQFPFSNPPPPILLCYHKSTWKIHFSSGEACEIWPHSKPLCCLIFVPSWNGWAADSLVGLPQRRRKKTWLQTAAAKKWSSWGLSGWCDSVFAPKPAVHFLTPPPSQCHYRESTPGRPSEARPRKTRSFLTETLSQCLSWKHITPVMLLHLSTILPLTGDLASSSFSWPVAKILDCLFI